MMPCTYSEAERAALANQEAEVEVAKLYRYALEAIGRSVPEYVLKSTTKPKYGIASVDIDRVVPELCKLLRSLSAAELDRIVYNGRDGRARRLADWWEHHRAEDDRIKREKKLKKRRKKLAEKAIGKLTVEELDALRYQLLR